MGRREGLRTKLVNAHQISEDWSLKEDLELNLKVLDCVWQSLMDVQLNWSFQTSWSLSKVQPCVWKIS